MNCQDISHLLDDGDISQLDEASRRVVEAHLPSCPDCARDWQVHSRLVTATIPPMPPELALHCRVLVAAESATRARRHPSNRFILLGTLVAVGAAAATLAMRLAGSPDSLLAAAPETAAAQAVPVGSWANVGEESEQTDRASGDNEGETAAYQFPQFTVRLLPLQNEATDATARAAVDSFYRALSEGLRAIPGLTLIAPDSTGFAEDAPAGYLITVRGFGLLPGSKFNRYRDRADRTRRPAPEAVPGHIFRTDRTSMCWLPGGWIDLR